MTGKVFDVISGIGILIAIYLFLANSRATTSIINTISTNATSGIKTLQGR
jgi:hypothetical protein